MTRTMFSWSLVQEATRRALATGALQPITTRTLLLDDGNVRFLVRAVSSLVRKDEETRTRPAAAVADPLGDYEPDLFVADLPPSHYVLLNKYPVVPGHVLLVTRRFERQERPLDVDDFSALAACLREVDGLGFYNGGSEAGASQPRKHLQLAPLPLAPDSADEVPMERLLVGGHRLPFRHAFAPIASRATADELQALYRELLQRCDISPIAGTQGKLRSAYNLLVRRRWMLVVPRSRACFETIAVNALAFAGSMFVRTQEELERVRAAGPMRVLAAVTLPEDAAVGSGTA